MGKFRQVGPHGEQWVRVRSLKQEERKMLLGYVLRNGHGKTKIGAMIDGVNDISKNAMALLLSDSGIQIEEIARICVLLDDYVEALIVEFNRNGFRALGMECARTTGTVEQLSKIKRRDYPQRIIASQQRTIERPKNIERAVPPARKETAVISDREPLSAARDHSRIRKVNSEFENTTWSSFFG